ncbi:MAG TPA: hypothetical protein VLB44_13170 [Kofleriaceae bacterium]|nr:hypothetical protein [Kofleriaceae bacterium]
MQARLGAVGLWGVFGVVVILAQAIYRLAPMALALRDQTLTAVQWGVLVLWVAFMGYSEGYRAFHKNFSPRVVARARHLAATPRPLFVALAPLYCMGFFHATRRRKIVSWSVTLGVIGLVILVRQLAQPWRGIIDAGVVLGLAMGVVSIVHHAMGRAISVPPDVPA